jgi:hypothetical protein
MTTLAETIEVHLEREITRLLTVIAHDDPLGVVVRGHLYLESLLLQTIQEKLADPGAIDLTRMNFVTKLDLAVAMKLVPVEDRRGYAKLNALRNQLSHNFDAAIEERDETALRHSLSERQKEYWKRYEPLVRQFSVTNPKIKFLELRLGVAAICSTGLNSFLLTKHVREPVDGGKS